MPPYHTELAELLAKHQPRSVIALGIDAHGVLSRYAEQVGARISALSEEVGLGQVENMERHDFAVVFPGSLEIRASSDASLMINFLRARTSSAVLVFTDLAAGALRPRDLGQLGFEQLARYRDGEAETGDLRLYRYAREPDTNRRGRHLRRSADDPGLWEKYRW
ncbi:MAG: DUF6231 family protein [Gammaproteobacteria bacterium]